MEIVLYSLHLMKKLSLIILLSLFTATLQSQTETPITLITTVPTDEVSDLKLLDKYFEGKSVIAMGESTHGTHEFFELRHRVFRYLVEYHQFNKFFLEADLANTLRINDYVHGKGGTAEQVIKEINLWPWMTKEMVELVEWMKSYNDTHPSRPLDFIGVDSQFFTSTLTAIDDILAKYKMASTDTTEYSPITDFEFLELKNKKRLKKLRILVEQKQAIDTRKFSVDDRNTFNLLVRHLDQIVTGKTIKSHSSNGYRDVAMAENILDQITHNENVKGFFWAHNGHMAKFYWPKKKTGVAGGILHQALQARFLSIGQDFDRGSFNALTRAENSQKGSRIGWNMSDVTVDFSPKGSFAANTREHEGAIIYFPFKSLPKTEEFNLNHIGASYLGNSIERSNHYSRTAFDGVILIRETTPTKLLKD